MDLLEWGRGPFTATQAHADGLSDGDLDRLVRTKQIVQLRRGVFISLRELAAVADDDPRLHAVHVKALQLAFRAPVAAAAFSAARIYGLEFLDPPQNELVVVSGDITSSGTHRDGYRLRVADLPEDHLTTRHGVTLTTPARTVVDLCAELSFMGGLVVADSAVRQDLVTVAELQTLAAATISRRGIVKVRRVFDALDPAAGSPLESASRAAFLALGYRLPLTQVEFVINGRRIIVDFFWFDLDLAGEANGFGKYKAAPGRDELAAIRDEKDREQLLLGDGVEVVRWGWKEVRSPELLRRRLDPAFTRAQERLRGRRGA
ncbi:MAG TPA: type IV toxin-antitoxin system AbiEi family antitoxin domain-containing protein [Sporichthya sp.]|nr:type IV toxin-antitoxin system AbiEi family antitoxin domain-containing protein [Sporichthya sp.]